MKLQLDPTQCEGYQTCAQVLPELITLDEWGIPVLADSIASVTPGATGFETDRRATEVPAELQHLAHRAVISCPRLALRLEE